MAQLRVLSCPKLVEVIMSKKHPGGMLLEEKEALCWTNKHH